MHVACLDFEGVLIPEVWEAVAERHGIDALRLTTRDIPDFGELMAHRVKAMNEHGLTLGDVHAAVAGMAPLPGAVEFVDWLRARFQFAIISDTFYEFVGPLVTALGSPMLLCHTLEADADGRITEIRLRQPDPKRACVKAFQSLRYRVVATGDSYNDIPMLQQADAGIFFCPSDKVRNDYPDMPVAGSYDDLKAFFSSAFSGGSG